MKSRREFLSTTCKVCGVAFIGAGLLTTASSCGSSKGATTGKEENKDEFKVDLSKLTQTHTVVYPSQLSFPVLLVKKGGDMYEALAMKCTHKGAKLADTGTLLHCGWHGSDFDYNGNVIKGPASTPLQKYATSVVNNQLVVKLS